MSVQWESSQPDPAPTLPSSAWIGVLYGLIIEAAFTALLLAGIWAWRVL